tara:strand:- start:294 stop:497 length:204 start_codon:yes stop_codon:yes gene_type:complete
MIEKQREIYELHLDKLYRAMDDEEKSKFGYIFDELENQLNQLQNENTGKVLSEIFNQWGKDNSTSVE